MFGDALSFAQALLSSCWRFFVSFNLPGTNFTPGLAMMASTVIYILIKFIHGFVGFGGGISANIRSSEKLRDKDNE